MAKCFGININLLILPFPMRNFACYNCFIKAETTLNLLYGKQKAKNQRFDASRRTTVAICNSYATVGD